MAGAEHEVLIDDLTRRGFMQRAGLAALVAAAAPLARDLLDAAPALAAVDTADGTLQAFADTMIPGRPAQTTDLGHEIHPQAIAGVDSRAGAVEADALALYHHPYIGFDALEPAFLADLNARSIGQGGPFISLPFARRTAVCVQGLSFSNPGRQVWEAAAAVPFTAYCAAGLIPEATDETASGYRVMGLPGAAPHGYRDFSYRRRLADGRTPKGSLP